MSKKANITRLGIETAVADTLFALIAGCAIMPAVFAFGISPGEGPGLVFITLPHIFSNLPLGGIIAIFFFLALLLAALTSSISVLEVVVAFCMEEFHMKRKSAVLLVFAVIWALGCLCSLSLGVLGNWKVFGKTIFDLFDYLTANVLMLIDFYGLPPEVVSILFSHAKVAGRAGGISYIMQLGRRWADDGVNSFELAEKFVD